VESSTTLQRLANVLEMRKSTASRPYHLLLTSALSLTPTLFQTICNSDDRHTFHQYIHSFGYRDRLSALSPLAQISHAQYNGYRALARLSSKGYFATILTTNIDSTLEDALLAEGLRPHSFQTLIVGRDIEEHIVQHLNNHSSGICIVKLCGSLQDAVIADEFPDFCEPSPNVMECVQRYLNQDIIIVGSTEYESYLSRILIRQGKSSVYYALPDMPTASDEIIKLIEARGNTPEAYTISGQNGEFATFFSKLETLLQRSKDTSPAQGNIASSVSSQQQPGTHNPITIFYSYAQSEQDEELRAQLETHLKIFERLGRITGWHRRDIHAGQEWAEVVDQRLNTAQIILLLISPDFIASPYCYGVEMMQALKRHQSGEACVIPILLRPVFYEGAPFERLALLPANGKAITSWTHRDEAFTDVVRGLKRILQEFSSRDL
jgi:hypothetical protein